KANFSIAEVAVFGPASNTRLLAANTIGNSPSDTSDGKTVRDSNDAKDFSKDFSKEIPGEGPAEEQVPGEGPAPELPRPPPFVFIPRGVPTSPKRTWRRALSCEPSCGVAARRLHRTSGPSLRPIFAPN